MVDACFFLKLAQCGLEDCFIFLDVPADSIVQIRPQMLGRSTFDEQDVFPMPNEDERARGYPVSVWLGFVLGMGCHDCFGFQQIYKI